MIPAFPEATGEMARQLQGHVPPRSVNGPANGKAR